MMLTSRLKQHFCHQFRWTSSKCSLLNLYWYKRKQQYMLRNKTPKCYANVWCIGIFYDTDPQQSIHPSCKIQLTLLVGASWKNNFQLPIVQIIQQSRTFQIKTSVPPFAHHMAPSIGKIREYRMQSTGKDIDGGGQSSMFGCFGCFRFFGAPWRRHRSKTRRGKRRR